MVLIILIMLEMQGMIDINTLKSIEHLYDKQDDLFQLPMNLNSMANTGYLATNAIPGVLKRNLPLFKLRCCLRAQP